LEELLASLTLNGALDWLQKQLPSLITLRQHVTDVPRLDDAIAVSVQAGIPMGIDGVITSKGAAPLASIVEEAERRWSLRLSKLPDEIDINAFLNTATWTESISKIVTGLLYRSVDARRAYLEWLFAKSEFTTVPTTLLVPSLHAVLEAASEDLWIALGDEWKEHNKQLVRKLWSKLSAAIVKAPRHGQTKQQLRSCMSLFFRQFSGQQAAMTEDFTAKVSKASLDTISPELLELAFALRGIGKHGDKLGQAVINYALQWAVRYFSGSPGIDVVARISIQGLCESHSCHSVCLLMQYRFPHASNGSHSAILCGASNHCSAPGSGVP
jgi:hypothetical protein